MCMASWFIRFEFLRIILAKLGVGDSQIFPFQRKSNGNYWYDW